MTNQSEVPIQLQRIAAENILIIYIRYITVPKQPLFPKYRS